MQTLKYSNPVSQIMNDVRDSQLRKIIRRHYLDILKREPDLGGLELYYKMIKNNEIKLESIPEIFRGSPEFIKLQQGKKGITDKQSAKELAPNVNSMIEKTIDGHVLLFDPSDKILLETFSKGDYEKATTTAIKKLVKKGMNVINIGANIGYFTLLMARQVGPTGKVFAFEPFPNTAKFLQKNVDVNGYKNVEVHTKAVSNKKSKADFWVGGSSTHSFLSEMKTQSYPQLTKVEVETITIDDFLRERNFKIDFMMMDPEGSEKYILEGMTKTLEKNPEIGIITEYNPYTLKLAETDGKSFLNLIERLGFSIYMIDENDGEIKPTTKEQIFEKITYPNLTNLYLTKSLQTKGRESPHPLGL